jgi:hypothetical protein
LRRYKDLEAIEMRLLAIALRKTIRTIVFNWHRTVGIDDFLASTPVNTAGKHRHYNLKIYNLGDLKKVSYLPKIHYFKFIIYFYLI